MQRIRNFTSIADDKEFLRVRTCLTVGDHLFSSVLRDIPTVSALCRHRVGYGLRNFAVVAVDLRLHMIIVVAKYILSKRVVTSDFYTNQQFLGKKIVQG
jgi:hypothetical protein